MLSTDTGLGYLSSGWDRRGARPGRRPSLIIPDSLTQCQLWPRLVSGVGIQRRAKRTKAAVLTRVCGLHGRTSVRRRNRSSGGPRGTVRAPSRRRLPNSTFRVILRWKTVRCKPENMPEVEYFSQPLYMNILDIISHVIKMTWEKIHCNQCAIQSRL